MNAAKYKNILEEKLLQNTCKLGLGQQFTFQHGKDLNHTGKTSLKWLQGKSLNVLEWPRLKPH